MSISSLVSLLILHDFECRDIYDFERGCYNGTSVGVRMLRTLVEECYERWCYNATSVGVIMLRTLVI